ncbi:S8 family serine peptidase [Paractinoplanes brasiliensis]|uniref:Type VII secretion-associated serine protease mycosin n=1 Tax=Paractinoplanes brasiliensis TaxID=52695 RepID=A0A4R6JY82_9ACTN|nr:S8 family serine peptidase [Actinoplanes brasiliensis]TDO41347.1 type VII secretion-associated serine protease mycosin [Actinoplanes brasiliensis]GID27371.1 hypothetical protein Abr02nite_23540 [Actinoplanes brasiliensis]
MKNYLRRYAAGAVAIGAIAGGAAIALPANVTASTEWHPATYGLTETPEQLLPTTVSTEQPVRVVTTTLDEAGKPVIKVDTTTSRTAAAKAVKQGQSTKNAVGVEVDAVVTATGVPSGSDTYRPQQWDFTKIRVADAWPQSTGAGVVVAVIDSGVDAAHPDLAGNVLSGYDAIANQAGVSTDPNGHGTHVAGTIAAVTGNGAGVSAIAPDTKILPIKVLGASGSGYMSDTAEGIIWAADNGAGVINMSLGGSSKLSAVSNAIMYARSKGVVVVASSGNDRAQGSPTNYPAADEGVIGVAATDSADRIATYSTAGSYVDVAAPGTAILSTYPTALAANPYQILSGTSMAAPHVAAVAALIKAYRPALSPDQVQAALQSSAVDLGVTGRDNDFGFGRIDAVAALAAAAGSTAAPSPTATRTTSATPAPTPSKTTAAPTPSKTTTKPVVKVRPAVKVTASPTSVVYGTTVTVTYTVTAAGAPWAGKPVQLGTTTPGKAAFTYTDATTDAAGKVVLTQPAIGRFQAKLVVPATETSTATASAVTTYAVRASATVSSPAEQTLQIELAGAVGQKVQVQRFERKRWIVIGAVVASSPEITVSGLVSGVSHRILVPNTPTVAGLTSAPVKIS